MARLRTLKPEFFTHEILAELSPLHRLLYAGLWCHADREGRLEDRPRYLKTVILPYDPCDVDAMLSDLEQRGFVTRYEADGKECLHLPAFLRHQNPHLKEKPSTLPPPPVGAFSGGPRIRTPPEGRAITHAPDKPGASTVQDRVNTGSSPAVLSIGLGSGLGSTSGLEAAAGTDAPEPEAFEPDSEGEYLPTAWGYWGWHNHERQTRELFDEPSPPHSLRQWHDHAKAKVSIEGMVRSYLAYLADPAFAEKGWPFAIFMSEKVWLPRANAPPRKQLRL